MIDIGLFELHPGLGNQNRWTSLAIQTLEIRTDFGNMPATISSYAPKVIMNAQCCSGDRWAVPLSAMLLALNFDSIAAVYSEIFSGEFVA